MNQFTFMGYDGEIFEHISKYKARKLHEEGQEVFALGDNTNPCSVWVEPATMRPEDNFDEWTNSFKLYLPKELGKRPRWFKIGGSSSWNYGLN